MNPHGNGYQYYLIDCINGSDSNDGIKKPFKTLDKVLSFNQNNDLRMRFLSPGIYPTIVQHFSGMSMHWDGTSAGGEVTVSFCGDYPGKRIQFYNNYTHLKGVKFAWNPVNQLYFESGYCAIGEGAGFISDVVRFNGMFMFAENASFYRLIVREGYGKLHNIRITKPSDEGTDAIHGRDSFLTVYGSIAIENRMNVENEAAVIISDRGRLYVSASPKEPTGYKYGIKGNNAEVYIAKRYLNDFQKNTVEGNRIIAPARYGE